MEEAPDLPIQDTQGEDKELEVSLVSQITSAVSSITQATSNFLSDLPGVANYLRSVPPVKISDSQVLLYFDSREFSDNPIQETITFKGSKKNTYLLVIVPDGVISEDEVKLWKEFGKLPIKYVAKVGLPQARVKIRVSKTSDGKINSKTVGDSENAYLKQALNLVKGAEGLFNAAAKSWKAYVGPDESEKAGVGIEKLLTEKVIKKNDGKYKWQLIKEEKIDTTQSRLAIPVEEIGTFEVLSNQPTRLVSGQGTLLLYFQGIDTKHGKDDPISDLSIAWVNQLAFEKSKDIDKDVGSNLTIQHTANQLGFDHLATFVFPEKLTPRGFRVSMSRILDYLHQSNFETVCVSYSTGATILAQWLYDSIIQNDNQGLDLFKRCINLTIDSNSICQTNDLEPLAVRAGKLAVKHTNDAVAKLALVTNNSIIVRSGGVGALVGRANYLLNLDNLAKLGEYRNVIGATSGVDIRLLFLVDISRRITLPTGGIRWYQIFINPRRENIKGYISRNIESLGLPIPGTRHSHGEIRYVWNLVAAIGTIPDLRKKLNFSPLANQIADEWMKRRFLNMEKVKRDLLNIDVDTSQASKLIVNLVQS